MSNLYNPTQFECLTPDMEKQNILIYGRVHAIRKSGSKVCFIILRKKLLTLQCLCMKKEVGEEKFDSLSKLQKETKIILMGYISKLPEDQPVIKSCSYKNFEFYIKDFEVVNEPVEKLPFPIDDADVIILDSEQVESKVNDRCAILLPTRLDNRFFELRTPLNNVIFKLQSEMTNGFRQYLNSEGFIEIHSPKLLGTSSESGASVFKVNYFNSDAFLAQSPQLYKQMAINADFGRVFEIGPVFRAENSFSHRHLCEFTGLDIEMELDYPFDYKQVVKYLWNTLSFIFNNIENKCKQEIQYLKSKHNYNNLVFPLDPLMITFVDGVKLLKDNGFEQNVEEDLSTQNEKELGNIVKQLYNSDLFVLIEYPVNARPFYTKKCNNPKFTKSYDIIMRGQEICSGAQRENDYNTLTSQMLSLNLKLESFKDYLSSFKTGSPPHGGGGFGLERILSLYFDLGSVKITSLFPRDPKRLTP